MHRKNLQCKLQPVVPCAWTTGCNLHCKFFLCIKKFQFKSWYIVSLAMSQRVYSSTHSPDILAEDPWEKAMQGNLWHQFYLCPKMRLSHRQRKWCLWWAQYSEWYRQPYHAFQHKIHYLCLCMCVYAKRGRGGVKMCVWIVSFPTRVLMPDQWLSMSFSRSRCNMPCM